MKSMLSARRTSIFRTYIRGFFDNTSIFSKLYARIFPNAKNLPHYHAVFSILISDLIIYDDEKNGVSQDEIFDENDAVFCYFFENLKAPNADFDFRCAGNFMFARE